MCVCTSTESVNKCLFVKIENKLDIYSGPQNILFCHSSTSVFEICNTHLGLGYPKSVHGELHCQFFFVVNKSITTRCFYIGTIGMVILWRFS